MVICFSQALDGNLVLRKDVRAALKPFASLFWALA